MSVDLFIPPLLYNNKRHILVSPATFLCVFSDCYVADELVVSRAGRRVRVGNTDAEGRMVMVDLLCEMKEKVGSAALTLPQICRFLWGISSKCDGSSLQAAQEVSPHIFTIATLTGHAIRAMGSNYSVSSLKNTNLKCLRFSSLQILLLQIIMDNGPAHRNGNAAQWQKGEANCDSLIGEDIYTIQ